MSSHLATTESNQVKYLGNIFLHARGRSRTVDAARDAAMAAAASDLEAEFVGFENAVSRFEATIAVAAVEQLQRVAAIAPGYESEDLTSLEPQQVDEFVRPIFEASGVGDDFIPWDEAFPHYGEPEIPDELFPTKK